MGGLEVLHSLLLDKPRWPFGSTFFCDLVREVVKGLWGMETFLFLSISFVNCSVFSYPLDFAIDSVLSWSLRYSYMKIWVVD